MFLKRLETVGFKSFAERIKVEFVPGVTAVVGPNGSGKSNITDAIRWVLGEQSAKSLRGTKMEDIIFQGSETRGALNVAEVTLVLDNQDQTLSTLDYDEVSVTRRVYRSGESEFYINKQSCRLKDIIDLFMDSGLGKEAFSIISQGKVEEILSSKAEERRTIFEEAAGVLKYKQRKKKAEYKLAETQENLNRIEDIIYELEQQMDPLKKQADTAKTYLERKELLKGKEISLLITEIEKLNVEWQGLLKEMEQEKLSEIKIKTEIQKREASMEMERKAIDELDLSIEELQADLLSTTQLLEQSEGKKQIYLERTKHYEENKAKLEQQMEETNNRIEQLREEWTLETEKLTEISEERRETKEKLQHLESILTAKNDDIVEQIEELKAEYIEALNQQAANRNEKQSIQQQIEQVIVKRDRQLSKFTDIVQLRKEYERKKDEITMNLKSVEANYHDTVQYEQQMKEELEKEQHQYEQSREKLYQGYQHIEKLKSKKEMLVEMKEDFQGFFQGVKAVLKAREQNILTGLYGAVIELIDVPKAYVTAIETVLGGQAQHVVVENDAYARSAIDWLKKTNNGRATFLPLQSIQARFVTADILAKVTTHPGFIGIAANLITTNEKYKKAVDHLMGHVIIAKTLKDANEIAKQIMRKYRIVTLEGDVVNPGGSMSGGAKRKTNQSLFTRESDLQELTNKLFDYEKRAVTFEQTIQQLKQALEQKKEQLQNVEATKKSYQDHLQQIKTEYHEMDLKLSSLQENLTMYDQDKQQYDADEAQLNRRNRALSNKLNQIDLELRSLQKQMDEWTKKQTEFETNKEQIQTNYHQQQILIAEQDERIKNQREKTKSIENQVLELTKEREQYAKDLAELESIKENTETEAEMQQLISTTKEKRDSLLHNIQLKRSQRVTKSKLMQDEEREIKEENKHHQMLLEKLQNKEVKANRLDVDLENKLLKLQTEYTITFEKALNTYEKVENIDEAKTEVQAIEQSIQRLGTVNLGAIDEYERISERYTFLTEQKEDLVEAKQTLFDVIAEMDEEMVLLFDQTFTQIKKEFTIVFKELFGGGRAELKLTDPNNLLETGVEIIAQPPGKKLQHLGLLSGGERALTAIALLFSILRVRPVPFCVLDEVEAALDEANVVRFAKYVKMYSENTQFIVITHRKGTMEEADVLYGVTMQESGVSRLVSVRLEETKELLES